MPTMRRRVRVRSGRCRKCVLVHLGAISTSGSGRGGWLPLQRMPDRNGFKGQSGLVKARRNFRGRLPTRKTAIQMPIPEADRDQIFGAGHACGVCYSPRERGTLARLGRNRMASRLLQEKHLSAASDQGSQQKARCSVGLSRTGVLRATLRLKTCSVLCVTSGR